MSYRRRFYPFTHPRSSGRDHQPQNFEGLHYSPDKVGDRLIPNQWDRTFDA